MSAPAGTIVHGLDARPPWPTTLLAAVQHLLAIVVGISTAPLVIARGMGLPEADTRYMISSALVVSGLATLLQVARPGPFGSGLLSVQGTSFAFVGPIIYLASRETGAPGPEFLGDLFGSAAVGAVLVMVLSRGLHRLDRIITPTVAGCTVLIIGLSLIQVAAGSLWSGHEAVRAAGASAGVPAEVSIGASMAAYWALAGTVVATILLAMRFGPPLLRVSAVVCGLFVGLVIAIATGQLGTFTREDPAVVFLLEPLRYPLGVDIGMLAVLLPVYLVSAVESIGDLTATSVLSARPVTGPEYWSRLRGGILADGVNSLLAALCATFPNTTFSQNNGVIRLTGVASRRVGLVLAGLLVVVGTFPWVATLFLALPGALINSLTLVMFAMVALAGVTILRAQGEGARPLWIAGITVLLAAGCRAIAPLLDDLPDVARTLLGLPVASAVPIAIALDRMLPAFARPIAEAVD